jgi:hypothetical protein
MYACENLANASADLVDAETSLPSQASSPFWSMHTLCTRPAPWQQILSRAVCSLLHFRCLENKVSFSHVDPTWRSQMLIWFVHSVQNVRLSMGYIITRVSGIGHDAIPVSLLITRCLEFGF